MSEDIPSDSGSTDRTSEEPIVLVGEPKSLRGELQLHNRGAERLVLREAQMSGAHPGLKFAALKSGNGVLTAPQTQIAVSATLQPGESQRLPLTINIGPHTPPGEYHGALEVAGQTRPLVLHVTEVVKLEIAPRPIVIDDHAGETVVKRVVFSNSGNIPLTVGAIGSVALGKELLMSQGLRASVGANQSKLESLFLEVIRDERRAVVEPIGTLDVRNLTGTLTLLPGEVRQVDLEIRLPPNLEVGSRYHGRFPIYTSDLDFVIAPVSEKGGQSSPVADTKELPHSTAKRRR